MGPAWGRAPLFAPIPFAEFTGLRPPLFCPVPLGGVVMAGVRPPLFGPAPFAGAVVFAGVRPL